MCLGILPTYIFMGHVHAWCLRKPVEDVKSLGTGVTDGMSYARNVCACQESNLGPVKEQPMLITAELSSQASILLFLRSFIQQKLKKSGRVVLFLSFICYFFFLREGIFIQLWDFLELAMQTSLVSDTQRLACFCFTSAGNKGVCLPIQHFFFLSIIFGVVPQNGKPAICFYFDPGKKFVLRTCCSFIMSLLVGDLACYFLSQYSTNTFGVCHIFWASSTQW